MAIQTAKAFVSYVVERGLAAVDAGEFEMIIPCELDSTHA